MAVDPQTEHGPPPTLAELRKQRGQILQIAETYGGSNVRIVGSVARGEADARSDLDLMMQIEGRGQGFAYFGRVADLERALSALLGCKVDVVDDAAAIRAKMRENLARDAVPL